MRHLRFLLIGLAAFAASCTQEDIDHGHAGGTVGELTVSLDTDARTGAADTKTDSETEASVPTEMVPELKDFEVELYTESKVRLYRDTYENTVGRVIRLNTGNYRLVAQCGDSLGCGFNKPYFMADHQVVLTPECPIQTVTATARLANVQLSVSYNETITGTYDDYYVVVRHNSLSKKSVKFEKNETRYGYIPAGDIVIEFYAYLPELGEWRYSKTEVRTFEPNDFVQLEVMSPRYGQTHFNLNVDGEEMLLEDEFHIPHYAAPQDAPKLTLAGFDENNKCRVIEGVDVGAGGSVSILARAAIASCVLSVESDILLKKGLPAGDYDLVAADDATVAKLHAAGIYWDENMLGSRTLSFINLAEAVSILNAETKSSTMEMTVATFSLTVVDEVGAEGKVDFSVVSVPITPVLDIHSYNVWATKVVAPTITVSEGANKKLFSLQRSTDNIRWTTLPNKVDGNGNTLVAEDVTDLEPGTTYHFRTIYNNNPLVVSGVKTIKTEIAAQIGNNHFEDFITESYKFSNGTRDWYLPWKSGETDKWWAVNSRKTMPYSATPQFPNFKVFPTVTYTYYGSTEADKCAQIATVHVNNYASDSDDETVWAAGNGVTYKAVGEIFIGTANDDGTYKSLGHAFSSRPTSVSFDAYYTPYDKDEKFYARIDLLDANNNVIAEAELPASEAGGTIKWTTFKMTLNYKRNDVSASKIRLAFRSSTKSDADAGYASDSYISFQVAGVEEKARLGSILLVDKVILNYDINE